MRLEHVDDSAGQRARQERVANIRVKVLRTTVDRKILRRSGRHWIDRVKSWTFQRFRAPMILGPVQGERLQLVGGTRPGSSWSLLLNLGRWKFGEQFRGAEPDARRGSLHPR
jgi:hypothetical protein